MYQVISHKTTIVVDNLLSEHSTLEEAQKAGVVHYEFLKDALGSSQCLRFRCVRIQQDGIVLEQYGSC